MVVLQDISLVATDFHPLGSVGDMLRDGELRMSQIRSILCQSLHALRYLHDRGIAHGRVQPSNMLVQSIEPLRISLCDIRVGACGNDSESDSLEQQRACREDIKALGSLVLSWLQPTGSDVNLVQVAGLRERSWTPLINGMIGEGQKYTAGRCLADLTLPRLKKRRRSFEDLGDGLGQSRKRRRLIENDTTQGLCIPVSEIALAIAAD